jgi:hypothetical protein
MSERTPLGNVPIVAVLACVILLGTGSDASALKQVPIAKKQSEMAVKDVCSFNKGRFSKNVDGSYNCHQRDGRIIDCNKKGDCVLVIP